MSAIADTLRTRFAAEPPARFWRSLGELSGAPGFRVQLAREFPDIAARFGAATDRRTALKLLGASLLMAGLTACKAADGLAPYVQQPQNIVPGRPRFFATSLPVDGYGFGVIAESHDGRPTKIEGNPLHPASLGGTDPILQASVWSLYDPSRSRVARRGTEVAAWTEFQAEMASLRAAYLPKGGLGLGIVVGAETSPTLARQLAALQQAMPALKLYRHAPLSPWTAKVPVYDLSAAERIVSLDGDFLGEGAGKLAYARGFADGRKVRRANRRMNRLLALESVPTLTGANADWVRRVRPDAIADAVRQVVAAIADGAAIDAALAPLAATGTERTVYISGPRSDPFVRAAAEYLNARAGAAMRMIASPEIGADGTLADLAGDIDAGKIDALLVAGVDLVHGAPGDLDIAGRLQRLPRLYHHGLHVDATAQLAHWHVPATHALEAWSDLRAFDGSASPVQPLIAPLYDGHTIHEVIAALAGDYATAPRDLVRASWPQLADTQWNAALKTGAIEGTAAPAVAATAARPAPPAARAASGIVLALLPDAYLRDGAYAANLPLNELPRPLTKLVWGNAAQLSAATAQKLGVADGDALEVRVGNRRVALPAFTHPGMPDDTVAVSLGWGRATGSDAAVGVNGFALMGEGDLQVTRASGTLPLISMQEFHATEGRNIVHEVALADWPGPAPIPIDQPTLLPQWNDPDEAWGMSIDLSSCIGCMACVSACVAENNSPVVGPSEMARGHDMHWLRVDRYYSGDPAQPETTFQPVPCMQCEEAPCEVVCPVNATVHTHDGLNAQIYNRCVGTRYCSQNCPYKVRRFNFFDYSEDITESSPLSLLMNPDVSVRERGVMEKCTYCVQRIAEARIGGDIADLPIADGTIKTACEQACPTRAITFGNIKDPKARVTAEKAEPSSYAMLAELGTRPRTTYLSKVRNV